MHAGCNGGCAGTRPPAGRRCPDRLRPRRRRNPPTRRPASGSGSGPLHDTERSAGIPERGLLTTRHYRPRPDCRPGGGGRRDLLAQFAERHPMPRRLPRTRLDARNERPHSAEDLQGIRSPDSLRPRVDVGSRRHRLLAPVPRRVGRREIPFPKSRAFSSRNPRLVSVSTGSSRLPTTDTGPTATSVRAGRNRRSLSEPGKEPWHFPRRGTFRPRKVGGTEEVEGPVPDSDHRRVAPIESRTLPAIALDRVRDRVGPTRTAGFGTDRAERPGPDRVDPALLRANMRETGGVARFNPSGTRWGRFRLVFGGRGLRGIGRGDGSASASRTGRRVGWPGSR